MMRLLIFIVSVIAGAILSPSIVDAAQPTPDMTVSPAMTEWMVKPGETQKKTVRVINQKDSPVPLRAVAEAFTVHEDMSGQQKERFDASRWFAISEPYFILKGKEVKELTITLSMPKSAEPGGHYATIYLQQYAPVSTVQRTIVTGQVGVLAFITTAGKEERKLMIEAPLRVDHQADGSINLGMMLKNTGNVHLLPAGKFIVRDWSKKVLATIPISPGMVLPQTTRLYTVNWKKPPFMGYVAVTAEIQYEGKPTRLELTRHLWILPGGWMILTAIIAPLAVWWFGFRIRRRWVKAIKLLLSH